MTRPERNIEPAITQSSLLVKWGHLLLQRFRIRTEPVIKVYHGFGTARAMEISGHVLSLSPHKQEKFSSRFWRNTLSLLRLFLVKPVAGITVNVLWADKKIPATTDDTGYFHAQWELQENATEGWHDVRVTGHYRAQTITGEGRLLVPPPSKYAIVSDIDDTFLISHSSDLRKRLYVLLTSNARTRQPFEGVVDHYQLLAKADKDGQQRPFFYVSSSEWNLYDYIREFVRHYRLPEGILLLSQLKQLHQFWKTGQGRHKAKYVKITRLLVAYPEMQFILLGDDSQEDPNIYRQLVDDFPGSIVCVYLRHVSALRLAPTRIQEAAIREAGVEICYFTHSKTAIEHSRKMGLIK